MFKSRMNAFRACLDEMSIDAALITDDGFVAQIGLKSCFPLPRRNSASGHRTRYAQCCDAVQDRGADLDRRNLTIDVTCREALTEELHTMHFRLNAALAVVSRQGSPQSAAKTF
jgi:hypothetical protein